MIKISRGLMAAALATPLLFASALPAAAGVVSERTATPTVVAASGCAPHTVGSCRAGSPHPRGATAKCKNGEWSYSKTFRGTCSHKGGVRYWYK